MDSAVVEVIDEVLVIVQAEPQDLLWSRYRTTEELVADLREHADRLRRADRSRLPELRLLFAPTGSLNEIAISSGWPGRYLRLAARFDEVCPS